MSDATIADAPSLQTHLLHSTRRGWICPANRVWAAQSWSGEDLPDLAFPGDVFFQDARAARHALAAYAERVVVAGRAAELLCRTQYMLGMFAPAAIVTTSPPNAKHTTECRLAPGRPIVLDWADPPADPELAPGVRVYAWCQARWVATWTTQQTIVENGIEYTAAVPKQKICSDWSEPAERGWTLEIEPAERHEALLHPHQTSPTSLTLTPPRSSTPWSPDV